MRLLPCCLFLLNILFAEEEDDLIEDLADLADVADDNVDQWEAVPLPPPPSEADLIRDSDELYSMHQSEVKKMIEQEDRYFRGSLGLDREEAAEIEAAEAELKIFEGQQTEIKPTEEREPELPFVFNTDDFDDDYDDVPGDSPLAPPAPK